MVEFVADIQEVGILQELAEQAALNRESLREQFGDLFAGLDTPWDEVLAALDWTGRIFDRFAPRPVPASFVTRVAGNAPRQHLRAMLAETRSGLARLEREHEFLEGLFQEGSLRIDGTSLPEASFTSTATWAKERLERLHELDDWLEYLQVEHDLEFAGLSPFRRAIEDQRISPDQWLPALQKRLFLLWLDEIHRDDPALAGFRGTRHEEVVTKFRQLDQQLIDSTVGRIRERLVASHPSFDAAPGARSEPGILLYEQNKKKRHKPLRRLFAEIPNLLPALKPCLLMSPLSVSQYLPADLYRFDTVIFDEASQVRPQDAIGAIMRAHQVIVVGDPKQLPPTAFFATSTDDLAEDEEDDQGVFESILDDCLAHGMAMRMLRWHYRSRHEHLIAFSNPFFYEDQLITFPSADLHEPRQGVKLVHVPDGIYDRGKGRHNRIEARRVADEVFRVLKETPDRSLGVVAFSEAQSLAILEELEARRRKDPTLEPLLSEDRPEPFFVKPLEQVQGDERDVMFLSVGYGKDATGRLSMVFGPLNRAGGERRLNVAVTRAREQVIVISSITAADIDLNRTRSVGVHLLKAYLDFAERGPIALAAQTAGDEEDYGSPFEEAVGEALIRRGFDVRRQVGCSGYRIDLAVVDREQPGRFLLGIECDGATYHSSKTARDRDRLRQAVLERLGWRIHRIWSTDWVKDSGRELQRVLDAIERAQAQTPGAGVSSSYSPPAEEELTEDDWVEPAVADALPATDTAASSGLSVPPYQYANLGDNWRWGEFHESPFKPIVDAVVTCVKLEGPIHEAALASRVATSWWLQRVGKRVGERIRAALVKAERDRRIVRRGEFLWPPGLTAAPVRGPAVDGTVRPIGEVPIEEIAAAAVLCTKSAFALPKEELILCIARMLGYQRNGPNVLERISRGIDSAVEARQLSSVGGQISVTIPTRT